MPATSFEMNPADLNLAEEGYIHYLGGVAYLHAPADTRELHRQPHEEDPETFVASAEQLMIEGAQQVIRFTNPPQRREKLTAMEEHYQDALPRMLEVVQDVFSSDEERGRLLLPSIRFFRPAAFLHENIYRYLCHSRLGKIATTQMMDGISGSKDLQLVLEGRHLAKPNPSSDNFYKYDI